MNNTLAQFSGRIYPDKSVSIGICPIKKKRKAESDYDRQYSQQKEPCLSAKIDCLIGDTSIGGKFCSLSEAPLFIKSPKSSRKNRGSYGRHGITNFGRRFVKNAAILLEQQYGKKRLGFATATLPSMDRDTCHTINGAISDITRRFYQKIRRKYQKRGSQFIYVGCVEIQEKRFERTSLPVVHLHFIYVAKDSLHSGYTLNTKDFYTAWNESVNECLVNAGKKPIMGNSGHIGSVKLEPIRASAAAYIGKYLSKGVKVVKAMQEAGFNEFPKQWWSASMQMKYMYAKSIIRLTHHECKAIFYGCEHYLEENMLLWYSYVEIKLNSQMITVGLVATLSDQMYQAFKT